MGNEEDIQRLAIMLQVLTDDVKELKEQHLRFLRDMESTLERYYINSSETELLIQNKCIEQESKFEKRLNENRNFILGFVTIMIAVISGITNLIIELMK